MVMACGMATIAGTVMALYASVLGNTVPDALAQLLAASLVSVPGALVVAALMVPSMGTPTGGALSAPIQAGGAMDAITQGTIKGLELLLAIVAMLVVLVALVSLVNLLLGLFPARGDPRSRSSGSSAGRCRRWRGSWAFRGAKRRRRARCSGPRPC